MSIDRLLQEIRDNSESEKEKGDKFERLMLLFFRTEPTYKAQFKKVWLWNDWDGNQGRPDTGIDLVAENIDGEGFTAIQCKNYAPHVTLTKEDIDSFFTESGKKPFTHRIIVSTTNNWSIHAENALKGQDKPSRRIGLEGLNNSEIDWESIDLKNIKSLKLVERKKRRDHQKQAIAAVLEGFRNHDRGKLIMACGTGKTFTAQCLTEDLIKAGGSVLVLVPSISLLSQSVKEWTANSSIALNVYAICSDPKAGRKRESEDLAAYDLAIPATTDTKHLVQHYKRNRENGNLNLILSTYQSINIVSEAQKHGIGIFDLIIADEAHRTTGVTLAGEEESHFTRVHDKVYIKSNKRLYMTATPRVYGDAAKIKAAGAEATLASMDDEAVFGPEFFRLDFYDAVQRDLLTDYKVIVLAVNEDAIAEAFQRQLSDENHELKLDDATRIVGCLNAFGKIDPTNQYFLNDPLPMKRIVAFSNTISNSKKFTNLFDEVSSRFAAYTGAKSKVKVEIDHVDGSFNSLRREELLGWLKSEPSDTYCHVLSNAKCLTEGVDVPALDAIVFLEPRSSVVDVVQAVGRVMRKSAEKKYGYIILPIGIPSGISPEEALNDNKRYAAIWQVLNALRSHDRRISATVNKLDLNNEPPEMIDVIPVGFDEGTTESPQEPGQEKPKALQLEFPLEEIRSAIYAKMIEKVGDKQYWENWAKDVASIAERHVKQIEALLQRKNTKVSKEFEHFLSGLQGSLNSSINREDAIEMLAQHLITKPVFDTIFGDFEFTQRNPVSQVMQNMIKILEEKVSDVDIQVLDKFYEDVRVRADGIDNLAGKQKIIAELYEKFFKVAFPRTVEKLGIVYTPVEVVDFMIRSIDEILKAEFKSSISDKDVHILDPFTGTGTFVTRLLQSELIKDSDIARKYVQEIHANEIVLLAYYIAAINIESSYHERVKGQYSSFEGIVLTDTFQMYEDNDVIDEEMFTQNSERAIKQKKIPIRVIFGNPPYSVGQQSQNDNNVNFRYPTLDARIESTYVKNSTATQRRNLYDSYIRAFRWATDRIGDKGLICFITNGSWIDTISADGFRKTLPVEFNQIYVINLRGNARNTGEARRREGGNVFGAGTQTSVTVTMLIKNPESRKSGDIQYFDIGDYLSREEKLTKLESLKSIGGIAWDDIQPNEEGDWINQRNTKFGEFMAIGEKRSKGDDSLFNFYTLGVITNRDSWVYNSSEQDLVKNVKALVKTYEDYRHDFAEFLSQNGLKRDLNSLSKFLQGHSDPTLISWSRALKRDFLNDVPLSFHESRIVDSLYRPFFKQKLYFDRRLNEAIGLNEQVYPDPDLSNRTICVMGPGANKKFSVIATDVLPNLHLVDTGQTFPMYYYEKQEDNETMLKFEEVSSGFQRHDAISDSARSKYERVLGNKIQKEDIFHYVYGLLHSPNYTEAFKNDLRKMLPRIPILPQFSELANIGSELMKLHIEYEKVPIFDLGGAKEFKKSSTNTAVNRIRFDKKIGKPDRSRVIVNDAFLITDIPEEAYEYELNGIPVLIGFMDRYQVTQNADSKLVNNPNLYSNEKNYVIDLFGRLVTVCLESKRIISKLPFLDFS